MGLVSVAHAGWTSWDVLGCPYASHICLAWYLLGCHRFRAGMSPVEGLVHPGMYHIATKPSIIEDAREPWEPTRLIKA